MYNTYLSQKEWASDILVLKGCDYSHDHNDQQKIESIYSSAYVFEVTVFGKYHSVQ